MKLSHLMLWIVAGRESRDLILGIVFTLAWGVYLCVHVCMFTLSVIKGVSMQSVCDSKGQIRAGQSQKWTDQREKLAK